MAQEELKRAIQQDTEDILRFKEGEHLFREGDTGGDLLLIEFGEVEVYRTLGERELRLTRMKQGELIGCFTCLTAAPRTASVRALGAVRCRVIPHKKIIGAIGGLPRWFSIILKEYGIRLQEVQSMLASNIKELEHAKHRSLTSVYSGGQFCSALVALGPQHMVVVEKEEYVIIDEVLETIGAALGFEPDYAAQVCQAIMDAGLLIKKIEPDKKREVFPMSQVQKLPDFPNFLRLAKSGKSKRMIEARWSIKTIKLARALVKFCKHQGLKTGSEVELEMNTVEANLKKATGMTYNEEDAQMLVDFSLIKVKETKESEIIIFVPAKLGRSIAHIRACQLLQMIDDNQGKTKKSSKAAA